MVGGVKTYNNKTHIVTIQQRNKINNGDLIEVLAIKGENKIIKFEYMRKENGEIIENVNCPQMIFTIKCRYELKKGDILIRKKQNFR